MKNVMKKSSVALMLVAATFMAGCTSQYSGASYSGSEALTAQTVNYGVVTSVQNVEIRGTDSDLNVGSVGGTVLGALAGSQIGGGWGRVAGGVGGAVLGGVAGNAIQKGVTKEKGVNISVRLDNGSNISVTQAADQAFSVGQRVKVVGSGSKVRVTH